MPYISITTSKKLTETVREEIAKELGVLITTIPGKEEKHLMIHFADEQDMFFRGQRGDYAFITVQLYTAAPYDAKSEFAGAVCEMLEDKAGIAIPDIYLNFTEFPNWCAGGALK
ncbi:MAG: hypothetical protein E7458_06005 [Ruminococcaceae bacterium]|nr:hypothetical protein [Oscillospiraceae bacterium]